MAQLNFKHLRYFWMVAKEGSIVKACERLHLTPQTISGQLHVFEESLGIKLFRKAGRNLVLTEDGQLVLNYANEIFNLGAELQSSITNKSSAKSIVFSVGITEVIPKLIAHRLLEPAFSLEQNVNIRCFEDKMETLLTDLATHKLDMVLSDRPLTPGLNIKAFNHRLGSSGISFFATAALAKKMQKSFLDSMKTAPFLLPSKDSVIRTLLMTWFDNNNINPNVVGEFDDSALMKTFGQAGVGVFPGSTIMEEEISRQYKVKVIGRAEGVSEEFYAISAERRLRHPAVVAICDVARHQIFGT